MRCLFIGIHRPGRSPSQRFRVEQFLPALEARGHTIDYRYLLSAEDDQLFYSHGNYAKKAMLVARSALKAFLATLPRYDRVFVQREAFFLGGPIFERRFKTGKLIYDFDDAIWIRDVSTGNRLLGRLKNVQKPSQIMALSDVVFAGNDYLAEYARRFNKNVHVIPTVIDTDALKPREHDGQLTIGWMGSQSTSRYLEPILPILRELEGEHRVRLVGDPRIGEAWSEATEKETLQSFDIGLMPLPDDEWARGKCGFKALQYMAAGAVAVVSPVGVNRQIVQAGQNGLLAESVDDWRSALASLLASPELRQRLRAAARQTVVESWSLAAWRDNWVQLVEST